MGVDGLTVRLLGHLEVQWAGQVLSLPTRKASAALAWLAAQPRPSPRESLAVLLWGPGRLRNVRQELYRLRKLPGASDWLREEGSSLALAHASVDILAPPDDWSGDVLEDLIELTPPFERFREELRLSVLERWAPAQLAQAEAALSDQRAADAAARLDRVLALLPEEPDALSLRAVAAAAMGDRTAALRVRAAADQPLSLYADRLQRLLAVTAAGHPDWPGPDAAPPPPAGALAGALGCDGLVLADALAELQRAGLVGTAGTLVLRPPLPGADAPMLHRCLAGAPGLPPAVAAWHLEQAGEPEAAARMYLTVPAAWTRARAAALAPPGPLRARALAEQLDERRRTGGSTEALVAALETLALETQSLEVLSERDQQRAREAVHQGDAAAARQWATEALRFAEQAGAPAAAARARLVRAAAALRSGDTTPARDDLLAARGSGDQEVELSVLNALGAAHAIRGDFARAESVHEQALTIARRRGALATCARLLNNLAATAERRADYARSDAAFREVIALGERLDERDVVRRATLNRAQIALIRGHLGTARALLRAHPDHERPPQQRAWANRLRGHLEQACGRSDEARERFARALTDYTALRDDVQRANVCFSRALLAGTGVDAALADLAAVAPPFLLATARMEALLVLDDPDRLGTLTEQIAAARSDPHAALLIRAGRARAAWLRGEAVSALPRPADGLVLLEAPRLLALCARLSDAPGEREALRADARAAAIAQTEGLLGAQRDALLAQVEGWLA